ncbi:hypothetical protein FS749_004060 [Ceratobasidium sp. UAMH 11750]|nr:hypothetical protein FS749_004060 [Ceratobasidium sp. UAMH 11750]
MAQHVSASECDSESSSEVPDFDLEKRHARMPDAENDWDKPAYQVNHVNTPDEHPMDLDEPTDGPAGDPDAIPLLDDSQVWVKRHPSSNQSSGLLAPESRQAKSHGPSTQADNQLPPYFPFRTLDCFLQAEIFDDFGATDRHINRQLALSSKALFKDAKEYHEILATEARLRGEFITKSVPTEYEGQRFTHHVHFHPPFSALAEVVSDPELAPDMVYYPEEVHVRRPDEVGGTMQVWEELWHGRHWWELQDRIGGDQHVLYLVIYIDETNLSKIGGVKVWPIYMWIGNLPASIRKRRGKKGGGILVGYLPKAQKVQGIKDVAGFRCQVYHDALRSIFETLKVASRYGAPMRCGDGIIRDFVPVIAAGSADYMEFIRMVCIHGHKGRFPCPICLVPRLEQSNLLKLWPMRTVSATEDILCRAKSAPTKTEREKILKEQSLRNIRSAFLDIIPTIHSIYDAGIADPLHQIEQGIWGKHLWPWIRDSLPTESKQILDHRVKAVPLYPDLKHFPNGITDLKYMTGKEHGVILRMIVPLIEDLVNEKYKKLILGTFRSLAKIYMMAKFTTHNDMTLERLDREIAEYDHLHRKLADTFEGVATNYPKYHSLSHLTHIIRWHSTTDNYHTGLGEALHPQSKKDYRRTNHHPDFDVQLIHRYQEHEAIMRIRARVDAAAKQDDPQEDSDSENAWDGPRIHFGSYDFSGRQRATTFVRQYTESNPEAKNMERYLRTFLYQEVGGFGNRIHFRQADLPLLDGMQVSIFRLVSVGYVSMLDSRNSLDIARATDMWRNKGPRCDYIIGDDGKELFVAQLLKLLKLKARGQEHSIAYVRLFKIGPRSKKSGFIELTDTKLQRFIFADSIIRSCVVLSPGIQESKHTLWDLEGSDMYLRLLDL